ncbi:MAG: hypothetical protein AAGH40_14435 [Verrucomicrobiota bacterium]
MNSEIHIPSRHKADIQQARPEFIRLPKPGSRCPHTGLSRGTLYELCVPSEANNHRPPVRSHVIRKPGAARGGRLVDYASLLAYVRQLPSNLEGE